MFLPLHYELPSLNLLCPLMYLICYFSLLHWLVQKQLVSYASFSFWFHPHFGSAFDSLLVGEEVGEVEDFGKLESEGPWRCPPLALLAFLSLKYVVAPF